MWNFLRAYPLSSLLLAVGGLISVASRLNDAYTLANAGLPGGVWEAIGLAVFFAGVVLLLHRWHTATAAPSQPETVREATPVRLAEPDPEPAKAPRFVARITPAGAVTEAQENLHRQPVYLPSEESLFLMVFERPFPARAVRVLVNGNERPAIVPFVWDRAALIKIEPRLAHGDRIEVAIMGEPGAFQ